MHIQPRKLANGKIRYYLRYWKNNKNLCVPKKVIISDKSFKGEYPFKTKDAAENFIKKNSALSDYKRHADGLKALKWSRKFSNFIKLRERFENHQKSKAPNSWESSLLYFDRFVTDFYLNIKKENNLNKWHLYFLEFKDWLVSSAFKMGTDVPISYSTKNHCIRTLNTFLYCMGEYNEMSKDCVFKCAGFERDLVDRNARTYKDIFNELEEKRLSKKLSIGADFFKVLMNTGMRFNEAYSLDMDAIYFEEDLEAFPSWIVEEYKKKNKKIYGYILLEKQCSHKTRQRDQKTGHVEKKALKGRRSMDLRNGRLIPISSKEVIAILERRYNQCCDDFNSRKYTSDRSEDYFIFNEGVNALRREWGKHSKKKIHCTRHSFVTKLVGEFQNEVLARTISGIRSDAFSRYLHIYEEFNTKAKKLDRKHVKRKAAKSNAA